MKQISFLIFLFIISTFVQAQNNSIVKKWKLIEIEEFGTKYPPTTEQQNDFIEFSSANKYSGLINGQVVEGVWSEKAGSFSLTPNKEKSIFKVNWFKVLSIDKEKLVLSYQSVDLVKTSLFLKVAE